MVENYGVQAFALEGDCGGCAKVNAYIHGGTGTAEEAAAGIGFAIYRTKEMADVILQNFELGEQTAAADQVILRDKLMKENVLWILEQEEALGHGRIMISGHNGHIQKKGSYAVMGSLLNDALGDGYYAIGTDFYKSRCNMQKNDGTRTKQVFYSKDPLAKAVKKAGYQ